MADTATIALGPDPIREAVRAAMVAQKLTANALAVRSAAHDPAGRGVCANMVRDWLTGKNRLATERASWIMADLGLAVGPANPEP